MDKLRRNDQLGVNKTGKNIKKNPLRKPNLANGIAPSRLQPQPQVCSMSKNNFTSNVQLLKDSPLLKSLPQPLPQNTRFQKVRPAAITQINRPPVTEAPVMAHPSHDLAARPPMHPLGQGSQPMMAHGYQFLSSTNVSLHMPYHLQSSLRDSGPNGNQMQPSHDYHHQPQVEVQAQPQSHNQHPPRFNGSPSSMPILPSPRFNSLPQKNCSNNLPSPRFNGRGILPSPTSQYPLQSPGANQNLLPPRSPYQLLSPGVQYPPPLTPRSFTFSSMGQPGILGPGTFPQPPPTSPGLVSPSSPFGGFPVSSPRGRDY